MWLIDNWSRKVESTLLSNMTSLFAIVYNSKVP